LGSAKLCYRLGYTLDESHYHVIHDFGIGSIERVGIDFKKTPIALVEHSLNADTVIFEGQELTFETSWESDRLVFPRFSEKVLVVLGEKAYSVLPINRGYKIGQNVS
jgi:hypothetical protein